MSTIVSKTITSEVNLDQLQAEINADAAIVPSCLSISVSDTDYDFEFAADLSTEEGTELDTVISNHVPEIDVVEISHLPISSLDGKKLAVHSSPKPDVDGSVTYAVWTGSGDDVDSDPPILGGGDLLCFNCVSGTATVSKNVKFDHAAFGRIWIHEAYLKFTGGGIADYISSEVVASASALQTSVNLDLVLDNDLVKYAPGGAGTGTHGFAATPVLIPKTFSKDGNWDYDGTNLTPNLTGTGGYDISIVDVPVHRFVNKIPCFGTCETYFSMTSDETAEIPSGYYMTITVYNNSDTNWNASVIMEIYREKTCEAI